MKIQRYAWIVALVFIAHYFSEFLEKKVVAGEPFAWAYLFLWYLAFIWAGDKLFGERIEKWQL